ncbi:MAG: Flagellar biosynthesis protein FliO [Microvirga sp.]|jgi:flagellar biogenesis protein FliO|nr:Flagellar biosynthesis protein FliO [Microvirga sp.]
MTLAILLLQAASHAEEISAVNSEPLQYVKLIAVLGLVLVLALAVVHGVIPRLSGGRTASGAGAIRVSARYPLEPKKNLYVVRVGSDYFLVGASDAGIHLLTGLDTERIEAALQNEAAPGPDFSALLQAFRRPKGSS